MRLAVFKSKSKIIALILCMLFAFSSFNVGIVAQAESNAQLQSKKDKIQSRINDAQDKLDKLSKEKSETEEYLNVLVSKIDLLQDKIDTLEGEKSALQKEINAIQEKIKSTENELIENQKQIDKKQKEFDENYELYCQRLRAMYVSGSASTLEVLLTCPDMSAMLTRSQMIKSVSQQDSQQLNELMTIMEEIEAQKQELEIKRNELNEDKSNLEEDKKSLQARIDEIDSSKSELDKQAAQANALMRKLSAQTGECKELIETNREELEQVEADIRRAQQQATNNHPGGGSIPGSNGNGSGKLMYPTSSRTITAGFPNYSSGRPHGGIDFDVPSGSNVCAAASGTVILVKYLNYSYGYHVMIDHGNGLATLYAHNSAIYVSVGQQVSAGQVIASSGSTGNSTGPHCHFEVRVNGNQVNPLNYL